MYEVTIKGDSLPDAYHNAILALDEEGEIVKSKAWGQKCKEMGQTVVVERPTQEPRISKLIIGGFHELQQYEMEITEGILNFRVGNGWDYTYNNRMTKKQLSPSNKGFSAKPANTSDYLNQIDFVISELHNDPTSRRAVISIRDDNVDPFIENPACLQHLQFFIRNGKLDLSVLFRSNDLLKAFFFNAWALIRLQEKIARELKVGVGTYTHRSNSMHVYEKDFESLENFAKKIWNALNDNRFTYSYKDEWKELMEGEIPTIMEKVKGLKT
jgi:thymidylate synthase